MPRMPYIAIIIAAAIAAMAFIPLSAQAMDKLITVTGEATVEAAPDHAFITLGVTTQAKTAREASEANARKMTDVFGAMKDGGIAERDIQTSRLSLQPQYGPKNDNATRVLGFQATNQVRIEVRKIESLPGILDRAIGAGANDVSDIHFVVSEQSKLLDKAREEAIADAHRKASLYAQAAGAKLGPVVSIMEEGTAPPRPVDGFLHSAATPATPIAPGEQTLRVTISVKYELAR